MNAMGGGGSLSFPRAARALLLPLACVIFHGSSVCHGTLSTGSLRGAVPGYLRLRLRGGASEQTPMSAKSPSRPRGRPRGSNAASPVQGPPASVPATPRSQAEAVEASEFSVGGGALAREMASTVSGWRDEEGDWDEAFDSALAEMSSEPPTTQQELWDDQVRKSAMTGNHSALDFWLGRGGRVTSADRDGYTALHWAACEGDIGMVQRLLDLGADPRAVTREKRTALGMAANWGDDGKGGCEATHSGAVELLKKALENTPEKPPGEPPQPEAEPSQRESQREEAGYDDGDEEDDGEYGGEVYSEPYENSEERMIDGQDPEYMDEDEVNEAFMKTLDSCRVQTEEQVAEASKTQTPRSPANAPPPVPTVTLKPPKPLGSDSESSSQTPDPGPDEVPYVVPEDPYESQVFKTPASRQRTPLRPAGGGMTPGAAQPVGAAGAGQADGDAAGANSESESEEEEEEKLLEKTERTRSRALEQLVHGEDELETTSSTDLLKEEDSDIGGGTWRSYYMPKKLGDDSDDIEDVISSEDKDKEVDWNGVFNSARSALPADRDERDKLQLSEAQLQALGTDMPPAGYPDLDQEERMGDDSDLVRGL